jgi:hypothetical protein
VKCRSCSAEIDAKAIVCYRCGTPTADPSALRPQPSGSASRARIWVVLAVVVVIAAFIYWRFLS